MSRLGRAAARTLLRCYPASWRSRYGEEVQDLVEATDASLGDAVDLARGALREHLNGGPQMRFELARRHPGAFAAAAAIVMAPTVAIVALSIIGHELGVSAVASAVDPIVVAVTAPRIIDLALVVAPLIALLLAALPLLDLRLEREDGAPALAIRVRAIPANVVVSVIALLAGVALVGHIVTESVLEVGALTVR